MWPWRSLLVWFLLWSGEKLCPLSTPTYMHRRKLVKASAGLEWQHKSHEQPEVTFACIGVLIATNFGLKWQWWGKWGQADDSEEKKLWVILAGKSSEALAKQLEQALAQGAVSWPHLVLCLCGAGTHFLPEDILRVVCWGCLPYELHWQCQRNHGGCLWQIATERIRAAQLKLPELSEMLYRGKKPSAEGRT